MKKDFPFHPALAIRELNLDNRLIISLNYFILRTETSAIS